MLKLKVVVVDDEQAALDNLHRLLSFFEEISLIKTESVPEKAIETILSLKPDLLFLDIEMPRLSGFDILQKIFEKGVNPKVVFVTAYETYAIKAIKSYALDYLLKPVLIDDIKRVIGRYKYMSDLSFKNDVYLSGLSNREKDILHLILQGKNSNEIAKELFISKTTVDSHRRNILMKTGVKSTIDLVVRLLQEKRNYKIF